jgi:hypothetical protein
MRLARIHIIIVLLSLFSGGFVARMHLLPEDRRASAGHAGEPVLFSPDAATPIDRAPASAIEEQVPEEVEIDLYGNEVTNAVARYALDGSGSLYETHSPRTESLRLGCAKT